MVAHDECIVNDACCPPLPCNGPMRYIQPEIARSCKPNAVYQRSCVPAPCETVYNTSYHPVPANCRSPPVLPICNIQVDKSVRMDNETVTALSYPGHPALCREKPIKPCGRPLFASGPMQDLTTQKHDYVPKCIQRRSLIVPKPMMQCTNLPLECETVHRLSFPNPCHAIPTVSCKPKICYQKPCMPVECDTTHKLSFQPVCAQAKEIFPWAQKTRFTLPCLPVENETTYKLSYLGGRGGRYPLVVPKNNPCMITCDVGFDDRTVYNDSFLNNKVGCRPAAIRPLSTLCTPNCKMDPDTMYNLAYQGHYCVPKQRAVLPCSQPLPCGPMQDLTTQRHDFVNKQICRREPIRPQNTIIKTCLPLDCTTTANASYMCPTHFSPSISCKPTTCYQRPCLPVECDTTQKLSFQPVCPSKKECYDWAIKPRYQMPCLPMDTETVQKLSYTAPGRFVSGDDTTCCVPSVGEQFPRASIC